MSTRRRRPLAFLAIVPWVALVAGCGGTPTEVDEAEVQPKVPAPEAPAAPASSETVLPAPPAPTSTPTPAPGEPKAER